MAWLSSSDEGFTQADGQGTHMNVDPSNFDLRHEHHHHFAGFGDSHADHHQSWLPRDTVHAAPPFAPGGANRRDGNYGWSAPAHRANFGQLAAGGPRFGMYGQQPQPGYAGHGSGDDLDDGISTASTVCPNDFVSFKAAAKPKVPFGHHQSDGGGRPGGNRPHQSPQSKEQSLIQYVKACIEGQEANELEAHFSGLLNTPTREADGFLTVSLRTLMQEMEQAAFEGSDGSLECMIAALATFFSQCPPERLQHMFGNPGTCRGMMTENALKVFIEKFADESMDEDKDARVIGPQVMLSVMTIIILQFGDQQLQWLQPVLVPCRGGGSLMADWMPQQSQFRHAVARLLKVHPRCMPAVMGSAALFTDCGSFTGGCLNFYRKPQDEKKLLLMEMACHLGFPGGDSSETVSVLLEFVNKNNVNLSFIRLVADRVLRESQRVLNSKFIDVPTILSCIKDGTTAMSYLSDSSCTKAKGQLVDGFALFLRGSPDTWLSNFEGSMNLAYSLKYCAKDSIKKTMEATRAAQKTTAKKLMDKLPAILQQVEKVYPEPWITAEMLTTTSLHDLVKKLSQSCNVASKANNMEEDVRVLKQVCATWMRNCEQKSLPVSVFRHVQVVTLLILSELVRGGLRSPDVFQILLGTVGTGEGKSLLISALSILLVKVHGQNVHVLFSDEVLRDRDFQLMEMLIGDAEEIKASSGPSKDAQINYYVLRELENAVSASIQSGEEFLQSGTILLMDEVDDTLFGEDGYSNYVREFKDSKLGDVELQKKVAELEEAHTASLKSGGPKLYDKIGGKYVRLDDRGEVPKIPRACAAVAHWNGQESFCQQKSFMVVSHPRVFGKYTLLLGLSGSPGSNIEVEFLRKTYTDSGKSCEVCEFIAPRFLQCCEGFEWSAPTLREFKHWTGENSRQMRDHHLALTAEAGTARFPVLVIAAEAEMGALKMALEKVETKVPLKVLTMDAAAKKKGEWPQLVENATEFADGRYPVTLVSRWGARGLDFKCFSSRVNRNGGILVVSTSVCAEREWIQWIGRTGRQDNPGQYAVYLADDDDLENGSGLQKERDACQRAKCSGAGRPCCCKKLQALVASKEKLTTGQLDFKVDTLKVASFLQMQCEFYYRRCPLDQGVDLPRDGSRDSDFSDYLKRSLRERKEPPHFQ